MPLIKEVNKENDLLLIELDSTPFYPGGGGQPCDLGFLENDHFRGEVTEAFKDGSRILHKVTPRSFDANIGGGTGLRKGEAIAAIIDQDRRDRLTRMHTGEHMLFKAIQNLTGAKLTKVNFEENESSLFLETDLLSWPQIFEAERIVNRIIAEDRPIIERIVGKEEAAGIQELRIKPERIKSETVRVIEIKDFDLSACTGTHAKSTGFIGNILVTELHKERGGWEIRFKTNVKEELFELARLARLLKQEFATDPIESIQKMKQDIEDYKTKYRAMAARQLEHPSKREIGKSTLFYAIAQDVEKKQLIDRARELATGDNIVLFISVSEGTAAVILMSSPESNIDIPGLLKKALDKSGGKGGGSKNLAMGSVEPDKAETLILEISKWLEQILN